MSLLRKGSTWGQRSDYEHEAWINSRWGELERLAQFFPDGTRLKVPVLVTRLPHGSSEEMSTVLEYGTSHEVIFRCSVPMEFGDRVELTNKDGSLNVEAEITAVQIGSSETFVAARFMAEIPNWIIKA